MRNGSEGLSRDGHDFLSGGGARKVTESHRGRCGTLLSLSSFSSTGQLPQIETEVVDNTGDLDTDDDGRLYTTEVTEK